MFIYPGAYSSTDRDNMNGMLYMLDIDRVKVYKEHDNLFFMFEGHKTRLKDIILK